jgi:hypothetical protein
MYVGLHVKFILLFSDSNKTWILTSDFWNFKTLNFMEILPLRAELFHADRRTDMTKLTVAFAILRTRLKWISSLQIIYKQMWESTRVLGKYTCVNSLFCPNYATLLQRISTSWYCENSTTKSYEYTHPFFNNYWYQALGLFFEWQPK